MIEIQLNWAISIYLSVAIFLVLTLWIFYNYGTEEDYQEIDQLTQCTFCGHMFFNYRNTDIISCPLCKSYLSSNTRDDKNAEKNKKSS